MMNAWGFACKDGTHRGEDVLRLTASDKRSAA